MKKVTMLGRRKAGVMMTIATSLSVIIVSAESADPKKSARGPSTARVSTVHRVMNRLTGVVSSTLPLALENMYGVYRAATTYLNVAPRIASMSSP